MLGVFSRKVKPLFKRDRTYIAEEINDCIIFIDNAIGTARIFTPVSEVKKSSKAEEF